MQFKGFNENQKKEKINRWWLERAGWRWYQEITGELHKKGKNAGELR